jgi:RES domain-containing protein
MAGGRWSPRGKRVVYACCCASTAVLEALVHSAGLLPETGFFLVTLEIPDRCYEDAHAPAPPFGWGEISFDPRATVETGRRWLAAGEQLALRVPSVVCPLDSNVLLNPGHEDMAAVEVVAKEPFLLDPRVFSGLPR